MKRRVSLPIRVSLPMFPEVEPANRQTYCDGSLTSTLAAMARAMSADLAGPCYFTERFISRNVACLELSYSGGDFGQITRTARTATMVVTWRQSRSRLDRRYPGLLRSTRAFLKQRGTGRVVREWKG